MNFNDIRNATAASRARARGLHVVSGSPADIQQAEQARQVLGHPGWDGFIAHLQSKLAESQIQYAAVKERIATGYHMPHDYHWLHLQATEIRGGIRALEYVIEYLPKVVKQGEGTIHA